MLSPTRFDKNTARHIVHKTQRWALRLAEFIYSIEHIPGESNLLADMLTRWAAFGNEIHLARRVAALRVPVITEDQPELPIMDVIAESQKKYPPAEDSRFSLEYINGFEL